MEEMDSSIKQNSDNAVSTDAIAQQAAREAAESGESVHQTVEAMREISEKITIIEDIARQTNMLGSKRGHRGGPGRRSRKRLCPL